MLYNIAATVGITLPALYMRWFQIQIDPRLDMLIFGVGILGASFLLSWAAEVVQMDVSRGMALAILSLIAVLPEYAVDLYFAWVAAYEPEYAAYATANMTGANRLLVGAGWPFIVFLAYLAFGKKTVHLDRTNRVETSYLIVASLYALTIPMKGTLTLVDCLFLVGIFAVYLWRTASIEVHEPELMGPAQFIAQFSESTRRTINVLLFGFSGVVIFACAEPFAESLLHSGELLGIDEFFLVQWLAPLASEAPEFIIVALWTLRGNVRSAMGVLIASKINQWTLLVGTIPLVYSISLGTPGQMPMDTRQVQEILLTAAQSIFAVALLCDLKIHLWEAGILFGLFITQFFFPDIRLEISCIYFVLAFFLLIRHRRELRPLIWEGLLNRTS